MFTTADVTMCLWLNGLLYVIRATLTFHVMFMTCEPLGNLNAAILRAVCLLQTSEQLLPEVQSEFFHDKEKYFFQCQFSHLHTQQRETHKRKYLHLCPETFLHSPGYEQRLFMAEVKGLPTSAAKQEQIYAV